MMTENDTLMEIVHLASAAIVADQPDVKRQAMADIYDAIASILPVEKAAKVKVEGENPRSYADFLTVAPGVTLKRFAGADEVKFVAQRPAKSGCPHTLFEISALRELREARCYRDGHRLFTIYGPLSANRLATMAVSALHRWFLYQRKNNSKRRH